VFQNIFVNKRDMKVYLWDDTHGMTSFDFPRYAYRRKAGGGYKSLYGDELEKVTNFNDQDPTLFESDVLSEMRILIDRYEDSDEVSKGHRIVVTDIEVNSTGGFPDITEGDKTITAIALYDQLANEYFSFILDPEGKVIPGKVDNVFTWSFKNEEKLLEAFLNKWDEIKPTIVTGWNTNYFDLPYLFNRLRRVLGKQAGYKLSPINIAYQNKFNRKMTIAGVSCLDYIDLYKKFLGVMKPSYSLANVAKDEELKVQKLTYRGNLNDLYKNDLHRYVEYNLTDVKVVVELEKKYDFIHLAQSVCHKGHVPYEWFPMSSRWIDGAILTYLRRNKLVGPNKPVGGREEYEEMERSDEDGFAGAFVKEPIPGLYDWICSSDIRSLYPSILITLNISPETKLGKVLDWDYKKFESGELSIIKIGDKIYSASEFRKMMSTRSFSISSNGVMFRQDIRGIIPTILELWFAERIKYKNLALKYFTEKNKEKSSFYDRRQLREKIFLNSVYGCIGLPVWRFYDRDNAEAVTLSGQEIIRSAELLINNHFNERLSRCNIDTPNVS
jgi:DNA polymerase elongation subunit (family B)